jgi:hypothetical protein
MRTLRVIGLLAACAAAACSVGCSRANSAVREQPPAPALPAPAVLLPPATDLTGNWATGTRWEPAIATITLQPGCAYNPPVWILKQTGNALEAWDFPESYNQGIAAKGPGPERISGLPGKISGLDVTIDDGQSRYVLRYDEESKHLRGTRDGHPFWAARQAVVRTEACPGFP